MKTIIAIFLSLQFLSNNTFAEEALRLPVLFEHFAHHQHEGEEQGSTGFFHFLYDHYIENHGEKPDSHHDNLPFKHSDNCSNHSHTVITYIPTANSFDYPIPLNECSLSIFSEFFLNSQFLSSIWQPPKTA
ncbi:MAG: hypothetical protein AB7O73_13640 [Bacteroidia bacterium]